jgi:HSP20 family protein
MVREFSGTSENILPCIKQTAALSTVIYLTVMPALFCTRYEPELAPFEPLMHMMMHSEEEPSSAKGWIPINVSETSDSYKLIAEVPGFRKDEISIDIIDKTITLKGKQNRKVNENENQLRIEKSFVSSFERSIRFAVQVDSSNVKACLDHGFLEISVGKLNPPKNGPVSISIE